MQNLCSKHTWARANGCHAEGSVLQQVGEMSRDANKMFFMVKKPSWAGCTAVSEYAAGGKNTQRSQQCFEIKCRQDVLKSTFFLNGWTDNCMQASSLHTILMRSEFHGWTQGSAHSQPGPRRVLCLWQGPAHDPSHRLTFNLFLMLQFLKWKSPSKHRIED